MIRDALYLAHAFYFRAEGSRCQEIGYVDLKRKARLKNHTLLFFFLALLTVSCGNASTQVVPKPATSAPLQALRSLAQARGMYIGTAVNVDALQNEEQYREVLAREFNIMTPEVSLKFDATEPERNQYDFAEGDTIVAFAKAHNMQVRGHTLVWFRALPSWLTAGKFSRSELMQILRGHIFTEVAHYQGQITIWDVVNEAVNGDGTLRDTIWLRGIGPDYIDWAFRWAHEANPQARLFYNDFGGEGSGRKSDAIYSLVKGLLQRGVPIGGVGLQMHIGIDSYPAPQAVLANMQRLTALGLEVQITEMDVQIQGDRRPVQTRLALQAQVYRDMLGVCLEVVGCTAFVMWGFTDLYSWLPGPDAPVIFDRDYRPKPAYFALMGDLDSG